MHNSPSIVHTTETILKTGKLLFEAEGTEGHSSSRIGEGWLVQVHDEVSQKFLDLRTI